MDFRPDPMPDLDQQPSHLRSPGGKKKFLEKKMLIIIGIVVGILAIATAAFFLLKGKKDPSPAQQQSTQQQAETAEDLPAAVADPTPKTFKSETLNVEFTHRADWTVTESEDKKQVTVTSPKFTYQTQDGASKQGVFTFSIGFGATDGAQKTINNAKAVKESLLIGYDAPTEAQRHYTNISYAGDAAFRFFMVTGSQAYKPGDAMVQKISAADFLITGGYGADSKGDLSFDAIDPTDIEQNAAFEQAVNIVKSLKVY